MKFPPPALFVVGFVLGVIFEKAILDLPLFVDSPSARMRMGVGAAIAVAGLTLAAVAAATFRKAKTAIMPHHSAALIVDYGPFAFSRNPMYLGMSIVYVGLTIMYNSGWPLIMLPLILTALFTLVISREERYLHSAFGQVYADYQHKVRRWI
ncbi:MAG: isoprenylcysteine carboxylmethyltransferase family protein [Gemmatimonadaceae bacterium]